LIAPYLLEDEPKLTADQGLKFDDVPYTRMSV
jgi:hypothetical protein